MTPTTSILLAVLSFTFFAASMATAEDMTINRLLASQCAQCHGTDGRAVGDMDELTDENFKDMFAELMEMRAEEIPEHIMEHQVRGYTEDQLRRVAVYYGSLADE